jgi:hypothetical protein
MLSPADRIVEATMPYTILPQKNNREKLIAAALEFIIEEYSYSCLIFGYNNDVIEVKDLQNLIDELKSTVTLEEAAQETSPDATDAL